MLDPKGLPEPDDSGEPRQKKSSPAKVEANQKNSRSSTGPTTARGKKNSSRNARKHGLLAKEVVITTGPGKEDQAEFDQLLAKLRDICPPADIEVDLLVQELADSFWKSGRSLRAERGELTLKSELPHQGLELTDLEISTLAPLSDAEVRAVLFTSSRGLNFLLHQIEDIVKVVQSRGRFPLESRRWLPPADVWNGGGRESEILVALKKEMADLTRKKEQAEENEKDRRNAQIDCAAIPRKEVLDRLHRYETNNRRHRYWLQARLDQLQPRKKADAKAALKNSGDPEKPEDV